MSTLAPRPLLMDRKQIAVGWRLALSRMFPGQIEFDNRMPWGE